MTPPLTQVLEFTPEQRKLIRDSFANGANDSEFAVLMEVARARRLNPLLRQIHFVKRWDGMKRCEVWSSQVAIDGLRAIAERTGKYDGQDEPEFEYDNKGHLRACKVRVYRKDISRPFVGVALFAEYVQTKKDGFPNSMWDRGPHFMLAKCAEALALRKGFPEDTAGLYVPEEMGSDVPANDSEEREVQGTAVRPATPPPAPTTRTEETKAVLRAQLSPGPALVPTLPPPAEAVTGELARPPIVSVRKASVPARKPLVDVRDGETEAQATARTQGAQETWDRVQVLLAAEGLSGFTAGAFLQHATGKKDRTELDAADVAKVAAALEARRRAADAPAGVEG